MLTKAVSSRLQKVIPQLLHGDQLDNIKETLQVLNSKINSVIDKLDMKDKIDHDVLEECKEAFDAAGIIIQPFVKESSKN